MKRAIAIISGRVQGVGYRNIIDEFANRYQINGYVKNLKDRTVEIVAEGDRTTLEAFFGELNIREAPIRVDDMVACLFFCKIRSALYPHKIIPPPLTNIFCL